MALIFEQRILKESELPRIIREIQNILNGRNKIALYGQLGAGKTSFTKAFCKVLGVVDLASSPTFSLINIYSYARLDINLGSKLVYHLDLYRLKNAEEAFDIGVEDVLYNEHTCFIEWPQVIAAYLPEHFMHIYISLESDGNRCFRVYDDTPPEVEIA